MQNDNCIDTIYADAPRPQIRWRTWAAQGISLLKRDAQAVMDLFLAWDSRVRERRQLAAMDPRMLKDIGLSRLDARQEIDKPFWKA